MEKRGDPCRWLFLGIRRDLDPGRRWPPRPPAECSAGGFAPEWGARGSGRESRVPTATGCAPFAANPRAICDGVNPPCSDLPRFAAIFRRLAGIPRVVRGDLSQLPDDSTALPAMRSPDCDVPPVVADNLRGDCGIPAPVCVDPRPFADGFRGDCGELRGVCVAVPPICVAVRPLCGGLNTVPDDLRRVPGARTGDFDPLTGVAGGRSLDCDVMRGDPAALPPDCGPVRSVPDGGSTDYAGCGCGAGVVGTVAGFEGAPPTFTMIRLLRQTSMNSRPFGVAPNCSTRRSRCFRSGRNKGQTSGGSLLPLLRR